MDTKKDYERVWIWCSDCTKKNDPNGRLCWNCALRYEEPIRKEKKK